MALHVWHRSYQSISLYYAYVARVIMYISAIVSRKIAINKNDATSLKKNTNVYTLVLWRPLLSVIVWPVGGARVPDYFWPLQTEEVVDKTNRKFLLKKPSLNWAFEFYQESLLIWYFFYLFFQRSSKKVFFCLVGHNFICFSVRGDSKQFRKVDQTPTAYYASHLPITKRRRNPKTEK